MRYWLVLLVALLSPTQASAHTVGFGLFRLVEVEPGRFSATLSIAGAPQKALSVQPRLPDDCDSGPVVIEPSNTGVDRRWTVSCDLDDEVGLLGLPVDLQVQLRVERLGEPVETTMLSAQRPSANLSAEPTPASDVAAAYTKLGVEHIAMGIDHLLFVLGLLLLVGRFDRRLLATITAFTLGHSVTLGLAVMGYVSVDTRATEAIIALSILLLAVELTLAPVPATLTRRFPWAVAAAFGLVHGLGFAGALSDIGLPADAAPLALFCFNLGVELGQVAFVAIAGLVLAGLSRRVESPQLSRGLSYVVGIPAVYWLFERLVA